MLPAQHSNRLPPFGLGECCASQASLLHLRPLPE